MRGFVNDSSLQGQFATADVFCAEVEELLRARARNPRIRQALNVARAISEQRVTPELTFRAAVSQSAKRDFKQAVLLWITGDGPFWDDERQAEEDDYFECLSLDVTDHGLGEAARRQKTGADVYSWSFAAGELDFAQTPLPVDHGLVEDRKGQYAIPNAWQTDALRSLAEAGRAIPTSWAELFVEARLSFPSLLLPESMERDPRLIREPFARSIAEQALALMGHLQRYMDSRAEDGTATDRSTEIIRQMMSGGVGAEPLFTNESDTNLRDFAAALTFPDATRTGERVIASWHGKIRHRHFRMHFVWPVDRSSRQLQLTYLGPKLTKS
ncbi:MAG: hypothetical protein AB7T59_15645 [Hyphomonadaceae bacterium]